MGNIAYLIELKKSPHYLRCIQKMKTSLKRFTIRLLTFFDAEVMLTNLLNAPSKYNQYFTPFELNQLIITSILEKAEKDMYWGIFERELFAGFYMLRGLDAGYTVPTYGVWISPNYSNLGLAQLTLAHAFCICKLNQIPKLMLKVDPQNTIAKRLYEKVGFQKTGFDQKNGNLIYHKYWE